MSEDDEQAYGKAEATAHAHAAEVPQGSAEAPTQNGSNWTGSREAYQGQGPVLQHGHTEPATRDNPGGAMKAAPDA